MTYHHPNTDAIQRYPSEAGSNATAFTITGGCKGADLSAYSLYSLKTARGVRIKFGAITSAGDNDTFAYRIWGVKPLFSSQKELIGHEFSYLGGGTATLGAGAFLGGVAAGATGRMADGLTWVASSEATTPKGPMTALESAMNSGGSQAFNPADDTTNGELIIPDCWFPSIIVDFDSITGDPLGMFALIERF